MGKDAISDFDGAVERLQQLIDERERDIYSPQVIQESHQPRNLGRMEDPDACAIVRGWCGDTMEIYLRVQDGSIAGATFMTDGCGPTVACGSKLTAMTQGLPLDKAQEILADDLLQALGGLPKESLHCAHLAVNALHEALAGYERQRASSLTAEAVAARAGDLMRQGYHCSEAMVLAVGGALLGEETARRCLCWASGFAGGLAGCKQEMCGALSGGVMVIGGLHGRNGPQEANEPAHGPAAAFREQFLAAFGTTQCEPIYEQMHAPDGPGSCAPLVERVAHMLWEILSEAQQGGG
jgi:nitrogen fixation NifU-like protein